MTAEEREIALVLVTEARELFDDAEPRLIGLQQSPDSADAGETINSIFRSFHSVKGSAATLGFERIARLTHAAESLLSVFRKKTASLDPACLSLLLQAVDLARQLLSRIEAEQDDADLEEAVRALREKLLQAQADAEHPGAPAPAPAPTPAPAVEAAATAGLSASDFAAQFAQESEELLAKAETALLAADAAPADAAAPLAEAFRAVHSFKGNCGFMGQAALEKLAHRGESLLDLLRASPSRAGTGVAPLLKTVDALRSGIAEIVRDGSCTGAGFAELERQLDEAILATRAEAPASPPAPAPEASRPASAPAARQDIRVDLQKLDALVNLVGELVIAEAMVTGHPSIAGAEDETLARAIHLLRRVSLDLQDVAMSVRMVPLSGAFRKLVRLVHDLTQKVGKRARLELLGEDTEVDKSVLEQLSDPLVHLVRNSIDHGLEAPEERREAGKTEEGTLTVEARHEGGEVVVVVRDDGRGLDRARILAKALERGLVTAAGAEKMSDEQVFALIFEPGFSTAEKVTDVSGRGVGMDVVRKNIERLQGTVELRSKAGAGMAVVLHIPLTLAIIDGMLVRVGSARYTVPLLSIRESLRPEPQQIVVTPDGQEVAHIRDRLIPVVRLHELFGRAPEHQALHEGILVIVEANGSTAGLFADEILGQQQAVIKGLSSYLGRARGVSGCTILGDGEVSLILDVAALLGLAQTRATA